MGMSLQLGLHLAWVLQMDSAGRTSFDGSPCELKSVETSRSESRGPPGTPFERNSSARVGIVQVDIMHTMCKYIETCERHQFQIGEPQGQNLDDQNWEGTFSPPWLSCC